MVVIYVGNLLICFKYKATFSGDFLYIIFIYHIYGCRFPILVFVVLHDVIANLDIFQDQCTPHWLSHTKNYNHLKVYPTQILSFIILNDCVYHFKSLHYQCCVIPVLRPHVRGTNQFDRLLVSHWNPPVLLTYRYSSLLNLTRDLVQLGFG